LSHYLFFSLFFFLYIRNILWVTKKPPKILIAASTIAAKPRIFENSNPEKKDEIKEPEMFEESNLEEDFEIPAFLRRQKN